MNPLKFFHDKPQEVIMRSEPGLEPGSIKVGCYNYFEFKQGITRLVELNSMVISSMPEEYSSLLEIAEIEKELMDEGFFKDALETFYGKIENCIHLGSLYIDNEKKNNIYSINKNGAVHSLRLPQEQTLNRKYSLDDLLINPAFMDTIFQACGVHALLNNNWVYLPWEIGEVGVIKVPRKLCQYKAYSKLKDGNDEYKTYDAFLVNENDEVCYYGKNIVMRRISI